MKTGQKNPSRTRHARKRLFEFYRIFDASYVGHQEKSYIIQDLPKQAWCVKSKSSIAKTCEASWGAGNFVALEVNDDGNGLPLSYWIIKIRYAEKRLAKQIHLPESTLESYRTIYVFQSRVKSDDDMSTGPNVKDIEKGPYQTMRMPFFASKVSSFLDSFGLSDDSSIRGAEAVLIATYLDSIPDIQNVELNTRQDVHVTYAYECFESGMTFLAVVEALIRRFGKTDWKNHSEDKLRETAETKASSARRRITRERDKKRSNRKSSGESKVK